MAMLTSAHRMATAPHLFMPNAAITAQSQATALLHEMNQR